MKYDYFRRDGIQMLRMACFLLFVSIVSAFIFISYNFDVLIGESTVQTIQTPTSDLSTISVIGLFWSLILVIANDVLTNFEMTILFVGLLTFSVDYFIFFLIERPNLKECTTKTLESDLKKLNLFTWLLPYTYYHYSTKIYDELMSRELFKVFGEVDYNKKYLNQSDVVYFILKEANKLGLLTKKYDYIKTSARYLNSTPEVQAEIDKELLKLITVNFQQMLDVFYMKFRVDIVKEDFLELKDGSKKYLTLVNNNIIESDAELVFSTPYEEIVGLSKEEHLDYLMSKWFSQDSNEVFELNKYQNLEDFKETLKEA